MLPTGGDTQGMLISLIASIALATVQVQPCGPEARPAGGYVAWVGAPSADLAPIGIGACTRTAWIDPLGWEVTW
jgi:hypothetical protein